MQVNKKTINKWKKLRSWGDVEKLATLLQVQPSTASRILSGKQRTTADNLLIIRNFFSDRKKLVAQIEQDQD